MVAHHDRCVELFVRVHVDVIGRGRGRYGRVLAATAVGGASSTTAPASQRDQALVDQLTLLQGQLSL